MTDWTIANLTTAINGTPEVWDIQSFSGATRETMTRTQGTVNVGNVSARIGTLETAVNHWQIGRPSKGQLYPRFNK